VIWPQKTGRSLLDILFLAKWVGPDVEIQSLNLTSGQRKPWTRFFPTDKTAVAGHIKDPYDVGRHSLGLRVAANLFALPG
jgi:hypothetical protein